MIQRCGHSLEISRTLRTCGEELDKVSAVTVCCDDLGRSQGAGHGHHTGSHCCLDDFFIGIRRYHELCAGISCQLQHLQRSHRACAEDHLVAQRLHQLANGVGSPIQRFGLTLVKGHFQQFNAAFTQRTGQIDAILAVNTTDNGYDLLVQNFLNNLLSHCNSSLAHRL